MNIAIIGGGVSGMIAAVIASDNGAKVTIFEHMQRMGKKLLLTGSGKCNISNADMDLSHFHSNVPERVAEVLSAAPADATLAQLEMLGLYFHNRNGYIYPFCEQASAVLDTLRFAIRDRDIEVYTDTEIRKVEKSAMPAPGKVEHGFIVSTDNKSFEFDRVIICCGSCADRNTGSDGSGYEIATKIGHAIVKPLPALTSLYCEEDFYPSVAGIRTMATVSLFADPDNGESRLLGKEYGQLQFTKKGISGICVMNLSHKAVKSIDDGIRVKAMLDLLPDVSWSEIGDMMKKRVSDLGDRDIEEFFAGLLAKPLGICICKRCGFSLKDKCSSISEEAILDLCKMIKDFETMVTGYAGFDQAQTVQGGVDLNEVTDKLESRLLSGLFFAGEILDVNGDCGGYNLQWAASSATVAALEAVK